MEKTLKVLNRLVENGVIGSYAIGGAMAALFYTEPFTTFDLDVFVLLPRTASGLLTLEPLYSALNEMGYREAGECVDIEGVPVQFLPAYNALVEEALKSATEQRYGETPTRALKAEHLVSIAVQTGRAKDRDRVRMLREQAELDHILLDDILRRHGLEEKWKQWIY